MFDDSSEKNLSTDNLASIIKRVRIARKVTQAQLAEAAGWQATQICRLENASRGTLVPRDSALRAFAQRLQLDSETFVNIKKQLRGGFTLTPDFLSALLGDSVPSTCMSQLIETRESETKPAILNKIVAEVQVQLEEYDRLENQIGISPADWTISAVYLADEESQAIREAERAASTIRNMLGAGLAPLAQMLPLIEACNVRILYPESLPDDVFSLSFFDQATRATVICLNARRTAEKQLFQFAKELGFAIAFRKNRSQTLTSVAAERYHPFVKAFASALLIPTPLLHSMIQALSVQPDRWTLDLICALKGRLGVSAEAFLVQLDSLKLISAERKESLLAEIKAIYEAAHGDSAKMEPLPVAPPLPKDVWLNALRARAGITETTPQVEHKVGDYRQVPSFA